VAAICRTPPLIDGKPDDACWQGCAEVRFKDNTHRRAPQVSLLMCQDAENLYLAYERQAARREGELVPFRADQIGDDAQVWLDDAVEVFLTDHARETCLWFGLSCSGGRFQRRQIAGAGRWIDPPKWRPDWWTDPDWHGRWDAAVVKTAERWTAELCIPRSTLADAGLDPQQLEINVQSRNRSGVGRPCIYLKHFSGLSRIDYCFKYGSLIPMLPVTDQPVTAPTRKFMVRLHFAETEDADVGDRVFDVSIQGKTVLSAFDIVREAGGRFRPLIKEFRAVEASDRLTITLDPAGAQTGMLPILAALEVLAETPER